MAFGHVAGVAANAPAFFVVLEAFLAGRGWILVAGGGTTIITYRSTGELGTLTQLYARIRRDVGNPERIYYRVQDDAAGTHTTTEGWYLIMPGLGAVPFNYWISGDKNCVIIVIKAGVSYTGCYVGTLESFALSVTDERYMHCTIDFETCGSRILRRYSGAYDFATTFTGMLATSDPTILDGSRTLYGGYVWASGIAAEIYGQPFYITYKQGGLGFNSEDTITSGYPGATSDWIAFLCNVSLICIMTAGILPIGVGESPGFTVQSGQFANYAAMLPTVRAFLTGIGWTDAAWYQNPAQNRYMTSPGESGVDDIRVLIYTVSNWFRLHSVDINGAGYQSGCACGFPFDFTGYPAYFPLPYYLFGDLDCFGMAILYDATWKIAWVGKVITAYPDETIIPHEYKQGAGDINSSYPTLICLRDRNGLWSQTMPNVAADNFTNSSPNLIDGVTYVLWPMHMLIDAASPYWIFGIIKYVYRLSGLALSVGDTVQIGGQTFQYLSQWNALRIV